MTTHPLADPAIREKMLSDPDQILDDTDLMRALAAAADAAGGARGGNVVDMRDAVLARLEARLARLEDTHESVVAAAYGNLAGMNMVHRAALALAEPADLPGFLAALEGPVADTLRTDGMRLLIEAEEGGPDLPGPVIGLAAPGTVLRLAGALPDGAPRPVSLRHVAGGNSVLEDGSGAPIFSEACLALDLGPGRLPGVLVLGSADPAQYAPGQGTDFLAFLGGMIERSLRRLLP